VNYMFQMDIDVALEFWQRVIDKKAETQEEREHILLELVEEGHIKSVMSTNRSKEQIIRDAEKNYGRVLDLTHHEEDNSNDRIN